MYQRKLKSGDKLWALEITHWKIILKKADLAALTVLQGITS